LSLDDYLKDNAMNMDYQVAEDSGDNKKDVVAEKGFKVMKTKETDFVEANTKTTNLDGLTKIKTNQIEGTEAQGYGRRPTYDRNTKKPAKKALNNDDFPSLG